MRSPTHNAGLPVRPSALAKQLQFEWRVVTCLLLLVTVLLLLFRHDLRLTQIDNAFYDLQTKLNTPTAVDKKIALIIIDDGSLKELGYWPWRRAEHARLLERLQNAKAVGFDIIFEDLNPAYPVDDVIFANALKGHGRTVLPIVVQSGYTHAALPLASLANASSELGFINIYPDPDGVVRRFDTRLQTQDGATWHHMTLAMLRAGGEAAVADALLTDSKPTRLIPFSGRHGHFESYAYAAVLAGHYPADTFNDRYVLIGAWSSGLTDSYPTPLSWEEQTSMTGVEILANSLSSARQNKWIGEQPLSLLILISLLPVFFICVILIRASPRRALMATIALLLAILVINWIQLHLFRVWSPPTASLIGTLLAYPVWHWRSQEAVLRKVNQELSTLSEQHPTLRLALQAKAHSETLPARLSYLHHGIELLREAQQRREQTLRFISHDMRAPQNSILALISMQRAQANTLPPTQLLGQIESYAYTTLELVDSFMDLAHAEAVELEFNVINVIDLIAEVCDESWSRAQLKQIQLVFDEPEDAFWLNANQPMLKRALSNLVDNAIKYSSPNTQIQCSVFQHDNNVIIRISDQGWGIPEHLQPTIFQAFHRVPYDSNEAPTGSGIGLAFVETVIRRHQGRIELESEVNKGSTFIVYLPIPPDEYEKDPQA